MEWDLWAETVIIPWTMYAFAQTQPTNSLLKGFRAANAEGTEREKGRCFLCLVSPSRIKNGKFM